MDWGIALVFAVAGGGVGALACQVLRRAARPAPVPVWWCAGAVGVLWSLVVYRWLSGGWPTWWLPVPLVVTALAVPLVVADLRYRRLPDALTLPAYPMLAVALGVAAIGGPGVGFGMRALVAAVAFATVHALVHRLAPGSLGAGDVKLAGGLGAVLGAVGWAALPVAACVAALVTAGLAASAVLRHRPGWRNGVPHGPGLLAATCLVAVFPGAGSEVRMGT